LPEPQQHYPLSRTAADDVLLAMSTTTTDFALPGVTVQLAEGRWSVAPGLPILLATGYAEIPKGSTV
jgi:hypothetical protein